MKFLLALTALLAGTVHALSGEIPSGALPDAVVAESNGPVRRAWLAEPTGRYRHGILGDAIEAGAIVVELEDGRRLDLRLPESSVFEDREVRLADLTGDGIPEMVVVESSLTEGAALAVYGIHQNRLRLVARDRWIGRANRWLNPAGIADFDGDGAPEIAVVVTPHIGGTLRLLSLGGTVLKRVGETHGFSNHAIGSRDQHLSAVIDWNGDGVPDLALPDAARRSLIVVSFAGGQFRELARFELPAAVAGNFGSTKGGISVPLANGRTFVAIPER